MTVLMVAALVIALCLARRRPLMPRARGQRVSDRWRTDHLYDDGKHGS